jgi:hypothetical protein
MKRILGIVAVTGLLAAAPAFAGIDVFVVLGAPAPVSFAPAPVYVAPVGYRHWDPRWHEHFERREFRDFRDHRGYFDHRYDHRRF